MGAKFWTEPYFPSNRKKSTGSHWWLLLGSQVMWVSGGEVLLRVPWPPVILTGFALTTRLGHGLGGVLSGGQGQKPSCPWFDFSSWLTWGLHESAEGHSISLCSFFSLWLQKTVTLMGKKSRGPAPLSPTWGKSHWPGGWVWTCHQEGRIWFFFKRALN